MGGGPVWDSNIFSKWVTYRPTLSKFRGGQLKKTPCICRGRNHHFWCPTASYPPFYSSKTLLQGLWSKAEIETESISKAKSGRLWSKHPLHSQYVRLWLFWPQPSSCFAAFLCQSLSPAPGHCQTSPMHLCILCIFRVFASWVEAVRGYLLYLYIFVCFN